MFEYPGGGGAGGCVPARRRRRRRYRRHRRRRQFRRVGAALELDTTSRSREAAEAYHSGPPAIRSAGVDALRYRFGSAYVTGGATAMSSALIRCETPTFSDAAVDRALATDVSINAGEDYAGAQTYFEPLAEAFVLSLEPRAGTCSDAGRW